MKVFVLLFMYVIKLLISILNDFIASHKIVFYSKLYDIDFFANFTYDRTHITLYVHEILLSLHQHCFLDNKAPRTTLSFTFHNFLVRCGHVWSAILENIFYLFLLSSHFVWGICLAEVEHKISQ